jgi:alkanesulfonate monooxygenase
MSVKNLPFGSPRLGVWLPVQGSWGSLGHPDDPFDSSYERNRRVLRQAEEGGLDTALVAQHLASPYGLEFDQLDAWSAAAGLAEATERIEIIAAIKPLYVHPAILAKLALGIDAISHGRFAINVVSGWFLPELTRTGLPQLEHDERYAYSAEWIEVVRPLMEGELVDHDGRYLHVHDLQLRPGPVTGTRPHIYIGGESGPGRDLGARHADTFLMNGRPLEDAIELMADVRRRAGARADQLRFGMPAFVVARDTDEEAWEEHEYLVGLTERDDFSELASGTDPKAAMFKINPGMRVVGSNGGTASGLVGSYDTVAARIAEFHAAGIDTFLLQFQPLERELERFIAEVLPRTRARAAVAS